MGNQMTYLSKPISDCYSDEGCGKHFIYGAAIMQGWRKHQEDRYICIPNFYKNYSFFAVYDGHGGAEIAEFLKMELHKYVEQFLDSYTDDVELGLYLGFLSCDESIKDEENKAGLNAMLSQESRIVLEVLKSQRYVENTASPHLTESDRNSAGPSREVSSTTDVDPACHSKTDADELPSTVAGSSKERPNSNQDEEEMEVEKPLEYLLNEDLEPSDPEDEDYSAEDEESSSGESDDDEPAAITPEEFFSAEPGDLSGSTATVALVSECKVYIANVGDSRCVLSRKGEAVDLSLDHKPEDPDEQSRITYAGGSISDDGRVNNCLNLSRAFGDFKFKGGTSVPPEQPITAEPFIKTVDIEKDDEFLLIASDGIWNSMTSQEVVDFVNVRLQASNSDLTDICHELFRLIIASDRDNDGNGCDNMTCVIVKLNTNNPVLGIVKSPISEGATTESLSVENNKNATLNQNAISRQFCTNESSLSASS